jgi:hypothetical protein
MSTIRIPIFDATEDAYWWVLCIEKYFKQWFTLDTLKMTVVGLAMKGPALTWWLRWYPHHRSMNWDAFTSVFLWQFKPEWRVILPLPDDDEDVEFEPEQLTGNVVEQTTMVEEGISDSNQHPSSIEIADLEIADSTLIDNDLNNSTIEDVQQVEENHVDDVFGDRHHNNLLVNPASEDIGEISTLLTAATNTILNEQFSEPIGEAMDNNITRNQGLSLKLIIPVALDYESQARMSNSLFGMSLNPFLDERKVVPMSVYANLDVDITGIQHDSRFVPPDKLYNCNVVEILGTYGITTTNCLIKRIIMMLQFMVDFCCFNGKCFTHNITTKGPRCEFVTHVANTLSSAISLTKPLGGGLFLIGCTMAPCDEFMRQCGSNARLLPPPKPPDRRFQQGKVELQLKRDPFMPPLLEPTDIGNKVDYVLDLNVCNVIHRGIFLLIGKQPMERIISLIISFHKPIMQHITIYQNLPLIYDYVEHSIVSFICNGRRHASIPRENFGIEGDHIENRKFQGFDCGTKSLVQFIGFDFLCQGPIFHEIIQYMIFSRCMLSCDKYVRMSHMEKAILFNIVITSKPIVIIFIDLEDKIIFRGVGNNMIHVVLVQCLLRNMLYKDKTICDFKDVEVEKLGKTRHKRVKRIWCYYNSDSNKFLVYEFISNRSLIDALCQRKATLLIAQGLFQNVSVWDNLGDIWLGLYQICMFQYREIHTNRAMMLTQAPWSSLYLVFVHVDQVGKVGDPNDDCINIKVLRKTCIWTICDRFLIFCANFKQWDPGQNLGMSIAARSSKFKQWDPGKIYARSNFYNLEDKVDFEGVGNVMIL